MSNEQITQSQETRRSAKAGLEPGTVLFVGEHDATKTQLDLILYNETQFIEEINTSLERVAECMKQGGVMWLNVNSVQEPAVLKNIGELFNIHPLTLEDIADTSQRPKAEEYPSYLFTVVKMLSFNKRDQELNIEHVSIVLGEHFVLSFLEDEGDVFESVRERLRKAKGRLRYCDADLCMYALMDAVVDQYFVVLEHLDDKINEMEDSVFEHVSKIDLQQIHTLRRQVLNIRKATWPLREEIAFIQKLESPLIRKDTQVYLRDLHDHTSQVMDMIENYREILSGIQDTYLSASSNRMNINMQALTTVATIFIPLTFIAGVYGMNFEYMPELKWRYGYLMIWLIMIAVAFLLVRLFRKRQMF